MFKPLFRHKELLGDRHRADTSSRPGKQLPHTMENSTDSKCEKDYKSLVKQCFEFCSSLEDKGCKFSFSLRLGSSFNFSLSSEGCSPEATQRTRRGPSYLRRQNLRRAAFLERKKKKLPLADETAKTGYDNKVCRQGGADLLENKKTASSRQTAQKEDGTVDNDCPLNLDPIPSYPRRSAGSVESDSSEEDTVSGGHPVENSRQGSKCELCQQIIDKKMWRHYPAQCGKCWPRSLALNSRFRVV